MGCLEWGLVSVRGVRDGIRVREGSESLLVDFHGGCWCFSHRKVQVMVNGELIEKNRGSRRGGLKIDKS